MTLRVKTLLISGVLVLGLITAIGIISYHAVLGAFSRLEEQVMRQEVGHTLNGLADKLSSLKNTVVDYAKWDDTYVFMGDGNAAYITNNLVDSTLLNLQINAMVFIKPSGDVLYAKGVDLYTEEDVPLPPDLLASLQSAPALLRTLNDNETLTGLISTDRGPMLVATCAVLNSEGQGPRRGTLLIGRYLDASEIQRIVQVTGMPFEVYPLAQVPSSVDQDVVQALKQGVEVMVKPRDDFVIAGYKLLTDVTGKPAFVMHVHTVRAIYQEGHNTLNYFLATLGVAILIYGIVTLLFLERGILNRLAKLSASVVRIGKRGDFSARVGEGGADELGWLAGAINRTLVALDDAHQALKGSEERYRSLIENSTDGIIVIDQAQKILYRSPSVGRIFGYSSGEVFTEDYTQLIHPEDRQLFAGLLTQVIQQPQAILSAAARFCHRDGTWRYLEGTLANRFDEPSIQGVVINFRDVTERKQAEKQIQRQLANLTTLYAGAQNLAQSLNSIELAQDVARTCVESFNLRLAWVGRAEPGGRVTVLAQYPEDDEYPRRISVRWDDTPEGHGGIGQAIRLHEPFAMDDLWTNAAVLPWQAEMRRSGLRSAVALPLVSRQRAFGALALYSEEVGHFTAERTAFFQSYALLAAAALENARLLEQTERRLRHVQALHTIDTAIASNLDLHTTLDVILEETMKQLSVDAACILLYDALEQTLSYTAGCGFHATLIQQTFLHLGQRFAGLAAQERRTIVSDWWQSNQAGAPALDYQALIEAEGFAAHVATPLLAKGQVVGVLEVFHRAALDMNAEWLSLLETLAGQAAISIDGATVFEGLQRSNAELERAYISTLEGWSHAMDLRDRDTEGHSQRVAAMTVDLARAIGVGEAELVQIYRGALLHDIGKLGVPDNILLKPGRLTDEEGQIMRKHPQYAYDMLYPISYLKPAMDIPYCHHEKWDGTGYPRGLKGEEIPLAARIFAVVDVWDALTSHRPYHVAWPPNRAREYIHKQSGIHFDPRIVEAFFKLYPMGFVNR